MPERSAAARLPAPIRLGRRHKRVSMFTLALLWTSGALWLLFHYFLAVPGPFGAEPHPLEPWWLRLHGLAMMLALAVLGSLMVQHAPRAWQLRRNRGLGTALTTGSVWLAASGYALYYFRSDANVAWLPLLHWIPGLCLPLLLTLHIRTGRRRRLQHATQPLAQHPVERRERSSSAHRDHFHRHRRISR